ncbi:hypothetical protein [Umezawaea sp. Da 62-37]|uniref:hypothetical protein n=1 Tax=Umezawaea sp. Da 62-37 TaxID=3075927 RepID=UPI0028F6F66C|nr:hypothetical protein [Umezawaea sp. Da 62-37]WNV90302.1 hypothetical protein RM788_19080 [Umezawaea sp. Da 62-37]
MGQLWDLWHHWLSGKKVDEGHLWGLSILAWGRIGKGLQFLAGLTVILDLIGPERLRLFGRKYITVNWIENLWSLDNKNSAAPLVIVLLGNLSILIFVIRPAVESNPKPMFIAGAILWLISLAIVCILFWKNSPNRKLWEDNATLKEIFFDLRLLLAFATVVAVFTPLLTPWLILIYGIISPLGRGLNFIFNRNNPGWLLRLLAFTLFLTGFHFDLLAS